MEKIYLKRISERLNEKELKNVLGGIVPYEETNGTTGTCGWKTFYQGNWWYDCGVSKQEAISKAASGSNGGWCCDSCTSDHCMPGF
jgi:bacteriocin-like protein